MLFVQEIYYGCPEYFFRIGRFIVILKQSTDFTESNWPFPARPAITILVPVD